MHQYTSNRNQYTSNKNGFGLNVLNRKKGRNFLGGKKGRAWSQLYPQYALNDKTPFLFMTLLYTCIIHLYWWSCVLLPKQRVLHQGGNGGCPPHGPDLETSGTGCPVSEGTKSGVQDV